MEQSTIFVAYESGSEESWEYCGFPGGWDWIGRGSTKHWKSYPHEEQFEGPTETKAEMIIYLHNFFKNLKNRGLVKKYKLFPAVEEFQKWIFG